MKRRLAGSLGMVIAALALLLAPQTTPAQPLGAGAGSARPAYVKDEVLVLLKPGLTSASLGTSTTLMMKHSTPLGRTGWAGRVRKVMLVKGQSVEDAVRTLRDDPAVEAAAPNYLNYPLQTPPNDTDWSLLWGMENTGQSVSYPGAMSYSTHNGTTAGGTVGSDVKALNAWTLATGTGVLVAVIDSGVDYSHPDLNANMWSGIGGVACPGGGAPTLGGCDFADGDNDPYPVNSYHGTHVAGTIAAIANTIGVVGIAYDARIMALKVFKDIGGGASDSDIIAAINYAAANGAQVINMSLGRGGPESSLMTTAVQNAITAGVLIVVAAGNSAGNNDAVAAWPANYAALPATAAGTISVLASDQADQQTSFTNYGAQSVTIAAPGVNILSTITGRAVLADSTNSLVVGADSICARSPDNCFNGTIFDNGGTDCIGSYCTWGWYENVSKAGSPFVILGDAMAFYSNSTTYDANIEGSIEIPNANLTPAIQTTDKKVILRYITAWDLDCDDYVDVSYSSDGTNWTLLQAPDFNFADSSGQSLCASASTHTHTGHMYPTVGGVLEVSFPIPPAAYSGSTLYVKFHFVTDATGNTTTVPGAIQIYNVRVDVQNTVNDATSYTLLDGTSMASPMVAGIGALVKSANPTFAPADIKSRIVNTGDVLPDLHCLVSSGKRINAYNALTGTDTGTVDNSACAPPAQLGSSGGSGGGLCLITHLTKGWLDDHDLDPLRRVRDVLWNSGQWGRAVVRFYYRASAYILGRPATLPTRGGLTATL